MRDEIFVDGTKVSTENYPVAQLAEATELSDRRAQRLKGRRSQLSTLLTAIGRNLGSIALEALTQREEAVAIRLTAGELRTLLTKHSDLIEHVELSGPSSDGSLATAMVATSTDSTQRPWGAWGDQVGIYMTEIGCPPSGFITNYTLISGSNTDHSRNVSSILRNASVFGWVYCKGGAVLPSSGELAGSGGGPPVHVITRSNGNFSSTSTYSSDDANWDDWIYSNRVPAVILAGNHGLSGGGLWSPTMGLNVITVGNYSDTGGSINSSSSFLNPTSKNEKPELSAPGTSIDAGGFTMTGTSQATPFVSAIAADLMQGYTWLKFRPALLKTLLMAAATDTVGGGFDAVGVGGIDLASGWNGMGGWWWEGNNGSFTTFASSDIEPNNGTVEALFGVDQFSQVRVVLGWLTRGAWTLSHLGNSHPIGIDLDLSIFDPNGTFVVSSSSFDNPFEVVNFSPTMSGNYKARITRFSNSDTSNDLVMGMTVNRN